ncbi:D123-domain-containing protein [Lactarius akahatsu]|uniref:D123-domain-containing protein n=1 Tax=Lactarius akahatsu TaxID=416441 RepID=A0AAD4QEG2_9AGAM|nr:D123-domain-containing protein [Lactarius akahatsu]
MTSWPSLTLEDVTAFQFSNWYPIFSSLSIKSTVVPLDDDFRSYLEADGIFVPIGSEDVPPKSTLEDYDQHSDDEATSPSTQYAFPELDARIRTVIDEYGAVFPKLNFSSPKDAAWLLPSSSPLKCTSPADVYLLLKSSDFITHDLDAASVFEGCVDGPGVPGGYRLELVLRKWFAIDPSREMRAFVRDGVLVGISQRDTNYYEFLDEPETQRKILSSFIAHWAAHVQPKWTGPASYTFDVLLTRDLTRFHIVDFNPYAPRTDALLFSYAELAALSSAAAAATTPPTPVLRVVDSRGHPTATRNAPEHQHNMVPLEALTLSHGRNVEEFAAAWMDQVRRGTAVGDSDDDSGE